jgi:O-antigen ligase
MFNFLLFITLYLPFQLALNPAEGIDLASARVLILFLFLFWLVDGLKNKKLVVRNNLQALLTIAFLFLNIFSVVAAQNTDWSWRKLLFLFSIFPVYFVASAVIDRKEKMRKISQFLVVSGAVLAGVGILQFILQFVIGLEKTYEIWAKYVSVPFLGNSFSQAVLENPSWLVNIAGRTFLRATAVFPDPHMLSFYLGLLVPLALGLFLLGQQRVFFGGALVVIVAGDLLTFSRGGYLGLFFGALALIFLLWRQWEKKYKIIAMGAFSLAAIALIVPSPVAQRFYSSFDLQEGSNQGRIATWQKAIDVVKDNPLFGTGIGNYPLAVKATANYREPIYAHSAYLDIAAETGIFNALVWMSLLLVAFLEFYKKGQTDILFLMGAVSLIIFAVHSLVETPIYSPTVLVLFLILISFSNIQSEKVA